MSTPETKAGHNVTEMGLFTEVTEVAGEGPTVLLLHGMGATGAVWRRVVAELGGRRCRTVVACDLPGHGDSPPVVRYTYGDVAEAVAAAVAPLAGDGELVVLGHSFGGAIAVTLASGRYAVAPSAAVATGVKVTWSADELAGAAALAAKPARLFDTFEEALDRYRKVSGLTADLSDDPADLARGITAVGEQYRLSHDPAALAVGDPNMAQAIAAAACPVSLSRGVDDPMVSDAELELFGVDTVTIPDAGHNVHAEQPARLVASVFEFLDELH